MRYTYVPRGVCSRQIDIEMEDGVIQDVHFTGGCNGNTTGVSALVKGRKAEEVIDLLRGIPCGGKATSCPDQLSLALQEALEAEAKG